MTDQIQDNWKSGLAASIAIAWMGWVSVTLIGLKSDMIASQLTRENVIPPVVESSLKELREKGNVEQQSTSSQLTALIKVATENAKDIGFLREQIGRQKQ